MVLSAVNGEAAAPFVLVGFGVFVESVMVVLFSVVISIPTARADLGGV